MKEQDEEKSERSVELTERLRTVSARCVSTRFTVCSQAKETHVRPAGNCGSTFMLTG